MFLFYALDGRNSSRRVDVKNAAKRGRCSEWVRTADDKGVTAAERQRAALQIETPVSGRDAVYAPKLSTCSKHR